jgi:hypothetical protein
MNSRSFASKLGFGVSAVALCAGVLFLASTAGSAPAVVSDDAPSAIQATSTANGGSETQVVLKAGWEYTAPRTNANVANPGDYKVIGATPTWYHNSPPAQRGWYDSNGNLVQAAP